MTSLRRLIVFAGLIATCQPYSDEGSSSAQSELRGKDREFLPRDAMLARYMPWSCVRLSVCVSVTSRSSTKMAKHRNMQTTPHDSPGTLVF